MAYDGFVTKAIVTELKNILINAKVNKVWQPNKLEVILSLYNQGKNYSLLLCANPENCRINLTKYSKPNPQNAYNYCMLLRKYLMGAKIIDISTLDLERTIGIKFECYNEMNDLVVRKLFIQIMNRQSNICLTNENNIIIDSIRHFDTSLPAHPFEFTPIFKNSFIELTSFEEFFTQLADDDERNLIRKLPTLYIGFSSPTVIKALEILNINEENYDINDLKKLYEYFKTLINNILDTTSNNYKISNFGKDYTISLEDSESIENPVNTFIDEYYYNKEENNLFSTHRNNLLKIILTNSNKVYKKLENINKKLNECNNMDSLKLYGELLTANLYRLNVNENLSSIKLENYYDENKEIEIPLDNKISVYKNVEKFYKKYNKLKNTLEIVGKQKLEALKEIEYIESIVFSLEKATDISDLSEIYEEISSTFNLKTTPEKNSKKSRNENKNEEHNLQKFDINGFTVYVGKNNLQNDFLTLKFAAKTDYWFHTQTIHGSHVILKTNIDQEVTDDILYECAKLAKENSKGSNSSNVPVDYCLVKFVKKPSGSKPGKVIYTNYKTIFVK